MLTIFGKCSCSPICVKRLENFCRAFAICFLRTFEAWSGEKLRKSCRSGGNQERGELGKTTRTKRMQRRERTRERNRDLGGNVLLDSGDGFSITAKRNSSNATMHNQYAYNIMLSDDMI